ncbi:hypothetical protein ACFE04_007291 [Oxalis oulophora]
MWFEIICGLVLYKLCKFFFGSDDDSLEIKDSDTNAVFSVAHRLEKLYGGKAYVGLRIPDADTGSRQNIDVVLVTKGEVVVISVKNFAGFLTINGDGSWSCEGGKRHKADRHPDPVAEVKQQTSVLESYLEQRGVALPEGYLSYKVVLPNPKLMSIGVGSFPAEVVTYEQLVNLKPEGKSLFSGWIKGAFSGGKKEMQESIHEKLIFNLSTAPTWDRLELKGNKYVLGEFLEFKGKEDDLLALRNIKRSKVSHLVVQKTSMFGLAPSRLQVLYSARDYRIEGASSSDYQEVTIRSSTEILFQPENSFKVRKSFEGQTRWQVLFTSLWSVQGRLKPSYDLDVSTLEVTTSFGEVPSTKSRETSLYSLKYSYMGHKKAYSLKCYTNSKGQRDSTVCFEAHPVCFIYQSGFASKSNSGRS